MDTKGRRFKDEKDEKALNEEIYDVEETIPDDSSDGIEDIDDIEEVSEPTRVIKKPEKKDEKNRDKERDARLKKKNTKRLEKLIKKKRTREEHSDREVLSYEDMPLREREESKKKSRVKLNRKRVTVAVIIVAVLFAIVFLFANSDRLSIHNITNFIRYGVFNADSDERFPEDIQGESISAGNFQRMGQDLCYASDTALRVLNNYGKIMFTSQHGFTSPVLVSNNKYSLVYSLGGTGYQINSAEKSLYTGTADDSIFVADIAENGSYAIVTQCDGYLAKLHVYDKNNEKVFMYSFADYYITSVSIDSNGRNVVASGLSAHNGEEISSLYVIDISRDSPVYMQEFEDNIIYEVQYLNDSNCAAVGNNAACVINTRNGKVESNSYEGKTLTAYSINQDTNTFAVSLSRSGDGRNCDIISYNTNGTVSRSFSTELRVISMSTYKGRVALLSTDTLYLYNNDGGHVSSADAGIDPKSVVLYTSADAYILDTSEIRSLSF